MNVMSAAKESGDPVHRASSDNSELIDSITVTDKAKDEAAASNNFFGGNVFGGWAMPDINAVTEGIGGIFGEYAGNTEENQENSADTDGLENADEDALTRKAQDIAAGASKELQIASQAAQETFGKAAEELGKGWVNLNEFLDDMLAPKAGASAGVRDGTGQFGEVEDVVKEGDDVQARFHELFPELDDGEDVVDHYAATILQKYRCFLNTATPEKTLPLRGRLFVTTAHLAMYIFDDGGLFNGSTFNITVPFAEVARVQKGAKSMMRVVTKAQTSFIFADFDSETHFGGALSLLEHMIESNSSQLDSTQTPEETA